MGWIYRIYSAVQSGPYCQAGGVLCVDCNGQASWSSASYCSIVLSTALRSIPSSMYIKYYRNRFIQTDQLNDWLATTN